ncbi:hypothetical protein EBR77_01655 [bacterium]|nr:hypothetical protein [bacterium]NBX78750.1 hypothetical protein [bacterium]
MKTTVYTLLLTGLVATSTFAQTVSFQNKTATTLGAPTFTIKVSTPTQNASQVAQKNQSTTQSITIPSLLGGNSIEITDDSTVTISATVGGTQVLLGKKKKEIQRSGKKFQKAQSYNLVLEKDGDSYSLDIKSAQ